MKRSPWAGGDFCVYVFGAGQCTALTKQWGKVDGDTLSKRQKRKEEWADRKMTLMVIRWQKVWRAIKVNDK